jgi:REP element-mobilizing transposase RayT
MGHSSVENYMHLIFATKGREPLIPLPIENRLYGYLNGIASKRKTPILIANATNDHLHMLIKLHPDTALSILLKELKSYSSGWLKKLGYAEFKWQEGYGGYSCSKSHVEALYEYIKNQKEHHKRTSFDEELNQINAKWGTSWSG